MGLYMAEAIFDGCEKIWVMILKSIVMKKIILLIMCFSNFFWNGSISNVLAKTTQSGLKQKIYTDSAIFYLKKSITDNKVDPIIFGKGLKMIDSVPCNNDIQKIEAEANSFRKITNPDYYCTINKALFFRLLHANKYNKAHDFAEAIIVKNDLAKEPELIKLRQVMLFIQRGTLSNKKNVASDYYSTKLKHYLGRNDSTEIFTCYFILSGIYAHDRGHHELAIYAYKKSAAYVKDKSTTINSNVIDFPLWGRDAWINANACVGQIYVAAHSYKESLIYSRFTLVECLKSNTTFWDSSNIAFAYQNIAHAKLKLNETDSVKELLNMAIKISQLTHEYYTQAFANQLLGLYFLKTKQLDSAEFVLNKCKTIIEKYHITTNSPVGVLIPNYYLALVQIERENFKQTEKLLKEEIPKLEYLREYLSMEYKLMAETYISLGDPVNATKYFQNYIALQDSINKDELENRAVNFEMEKKIMDSENTISNLETQKQIATISRNYIIGIACLILILTFIIYNRYRLKQKSNAQLSKTLQELKDTQTQLVQSEKLATFGAVATRVAHEIQNPLNFVTNFSNLSQELLSEIMNSKNEEDKKESAKLLNENLQKINHHGKRADSIVKQLFEHTKAGTAHEYFEENN